MAVFLTLCALPAGACAAESIPVTARLQVEPSVGASLALSLVDGMIVQIYLPGSRTSEVYRSQLPPLFGSLQTLDGIQFWSDSAVSLRMEHRAADAATGDAGEGGALIVLAQFN